MQNKSQATTQPKTLCAALWAVDRIYQENARSIQYWKSRNDFFERVRKEHKIYNMEKLLEEALRHTETLGGMH